MTHRFFATASRGTEGALRAELRSLGMREVRGARGGVHFAGELVDGARACLWSRVAVRVLVELSTGPAHDAAALYETARAVDWTPWITPRHTLAVRATGHGRGFNHTGFIALKVKDAVVDQLREASGQRPDVATRDPDVSVQVHLERDEARLMLDLAGEPLHRRGFRRSVVEAVMKETLAAAVLRVVEWDPNEPFCDPLCGAGTLALEAAMISRDMAPGLRRGFGFERWPAFDDLELRRAWEDLREDARARERPSPLAPIEASDHDPVAVDATRANLRAAGLTESVTVSQRDLRALERPARPGWVVTDPPYGERTSTRPLQRAGFYRQVAEAMRARGGTVAMLVADPELRRSMGTPPDLEHAVWNGDIECRVFRWRL
ncbi:MAG: THUMP domain-containing protein [Polyangiales bacterium]